MSVVSTDLRNVAIVGHNGTGKTTLVEQMLFQANAIEKVEAIENGKTVSDFTEEEIARKISVHTSLNSLSWDGKVFNLLDTPGTADFIGEAICGFRSCETSLMLLDSVDGIQIETMKLWRRLDNRNKPRAVFINKMDKERADYNAVIESLRQRFKTTFVPITIPVGKGKDFKGVVNLIDRQFYIMNENGKCMPTSIPEEYISLTDSYHEALVENAAEGADDLIEKFFADGTLQAEDIRRGLREGMANNRVVPVFCGQANKGLGVFSLMNFIRNNFPNPLGKNEWILSGEEQHKDLSITSEGAASAYCFKTTLDQFNGKLSFLKVVTGAIRGETEMLTWPGGKKVRPGKVYRMVGKKLIETEVLNAGDIGVITKAEAVETNSTLLEDQNADFTFQPLKLPAPVYSLAISTEDKKSEVKMNEALYKVTEEDLTFKTGYNEETKESFVAGMGELHLSLILDRIRDKQKIEITTKLPRVAYRETITKASGLSEYTHKKQSGGHGQYAKVLLEIAPIARGEIYSFTNAVKGGSISKGYIPGIEKGLHEQMNEGFLAGYPMVDIGITLIDGKEHPVDSSEMAFKMAGKGAMKEALGKAGCILMEPIMKIQIYIENEYLGAILSDLSSKRGRVLGQEEMGSLQVVKAYVPQSEVLNYAIDLKSMTSGTGSFDLEFNRYEQLQGKLAEEVIQEYRDSHQVMGE